MQRCAKSPLGFIADGNIESLLQLAIEYEIATLRTHCRNYILRQMQDPSCKSENMVIYMLLAEEGGFEPLYELGVDRIARLRPEQFSAAREKLLVEKKASADVFKHRLEFIETGVLKSEAFVYQVIFAENWYEAWISNQMHSKVPPLQLRNG